MSRVLINGQDVNMTDGFPEMNYDEWKALPKELRPDFTIIKDRDYTGEPLDNSVSVTADGVKTYSQCLDALYTLIDRNKITRNAILKIDVGTTIFYGSLAVDIVSTGVLLFYNTNSSTLNFSNSVNVKLTSSGSIYQGCRAQGSSPYNVFSDYSSDVPASGTVFTLYYNIVSSGGVEEVETKDIIPVANKTQMGSKKTVVKSGNSYYINAVILVLSGASISANETIATLPYDLHACYIIGRLDSDGSLLLLTAENNKLIYQFGTIPSGSVIRIGSTVIK